ncbi:MAG: nitrate reductase molybdenum cofactor assembly chaperone [Rhodanobacteraceae bacterium]|nr:nitrate reductase molybdenum cofactor assembly chaperone [Rhodanobacteraceae bacterium]
MRLLKLVAVLLDYPADGLWEHADELRAAVAEPGLSSARRASLLQFLDGLLAADPMAAQERWLDLFDRGRAMSLLLFEHIHGESRDRGQAMVDLLSTYRRHGFELSARQLPDYLPVVLEYLSLRPAEEVRDWLSHVAHILELLAARAQERRSDYAALLEVLVEVAAGHVDVELLRRRVASEERDDTPEAMDRVWEEEAVRFGVEAPGEDCSPPGRSWSGAKRTEPTVMP